MPDTAINVEPRRAQLIAALQANDAYTFLALIGPYLSDVPDDHEALEWAVKTCTAMRLMSHGQRLLAAADPPEEVRDRLEPLINGRDSRVAWSQLRERYEANLAVFDRRTGLGESVNALWRASASTLQLLQTADGCLQVYSRLAEAPGWLPALAKHDGAADVGALRKDWDKRIICPLALHGIGLGYTASALIEASRETLLDFSAPVFLIEPSLLAWAVVMHLHDWREAFGEPRVHICAGEHALTDFQDKLDDGEVAVPALINGGPQWPGGIAQQSVETVVKSFAASRQQAQVRLYERVCRKTAARDRIWWADRYAKAGNSGLPLTVLGVTSRFTTVLQYTMRDLLAAFRSMGCRTHLIIERDASSYFSPIRTLQAIDEHDPDLIVNIDHLQAEYPNLYPATVPGLCWIQDQLPHLFNPQAGSNVRPLEFVAGHGFPEALLKFNYPADRFRPCLIPTDPDQMLDPNETDEDLAPYRCDVMYASNASSPPDKFYEAYRNRASEPVRPLLDALFESLRAIIARPQFSGDYDYAGLLERVEADTGVQISDAASRADVIGTLMRGVADITLRERTVRAAAGWADRSGGRFHLYGRGWNERPEFARFAKGFVKHGPDLGRAFRAATISLHAGTNSALHQRVLDGLCAGGFFLIQEKSSDSAHETSMAVYRYLLEERPSVPFVMKAEYLPAPYDERYREMHRVRGIDPEHGLLFDRSQYMFKMFHGGRGRMPMASGYWPEYQQVVYRDEAHLCDRIEYFRAHADERKQLAAKMRRAVLENFTYKALARDMIEQVRQWLSAASFTSNESGVGE